VPEASGRQCALHSQLALLLALSDFLSLHAASVGCVNRGANRTEYPIGGRVQPCAPQPTNQPKDQLVELKISQSRWAVEKDLKVERDSQRSFLTMRAPCTPQAVMA